MPERSKYYHTFTDTLRFDDEIQIAMDNLIVFINDFYIKHETKSLKPKCNIDFYNLEKDIHKEKVAREYFKFGLTLIYHGLMPAALNIIMENAYEVIIDNFKEENIKILRLELLFIKKSISLLHIGERKEFIDFCGQLVSCNVDMNKYYDFFRA